jgi:putative hemolysin
MSTEPPSPRRDRHISFHQKGAAPLSLVLGGFFLAAPVGALAAGLGLASQTSTPLLIGGSVVALILIIAINALYVVGQKSIDILKPHHLKLLESSEEDDLHPSVIKANTRRRDRLKRLLDSQELLVNALSMGSFAMWCWLILALVVPAIPLSAWFEAQAWWPAAVPALLPSLILLSVPAAALNATFGQLVPTSLAAEHPVDTCLRYGSAARFIALPFVPAAKASVAIGGLITERFGAKAGFDLTNTATQQIINVLENAEESDEETTPELEMLDSVIEFTRSVAREVMTPRVDIVSIAREATIAEAAEMVNEHRKSRLPVNAGTDDSILGAVHAKDILLAVTHGQSGEPVTAIMRPVIFVPETKPLQALLTEMQANRAGLAIVQDEYGGTEGIVTTEDIVEEILGEIVDEHDREEPMLKPEGAGWTAGGKMNLEDLGHEIGIEIRSREFDTIGGYVFGLFGRQPEPGDTADEEGLRFTVLETDGRRITQVHIEPLQAEASVSSG